jgi:hypothetical protein
MMTQHRASQSANGLRRDVGRCYPRSCPLPSSALCICPNRLVGGANCLCDSYRGISTMRRRGLRSVRLPCRSAFVRLRHSPTPTRAPRRCSVAGAGDTGHGAEACRKPSGQSHLHPSLQGRGDRNSWQQVIFDESARWSAFSWRTALNSALAQEASVYAGASTGFKEAAFKGGSSARTRPKPVSNSGRSDPRRCWLMRPT